MKSTECKTHTWSKVGNHWDCDTCDITRTLDPSKKPDIKESSLMEMATEQNPWLIAKGLANKPSSRGQNPIEALARTRSGTTAQNMWKELFSTLEPADLHLIEKSQRLSLVEQIIRVIEKKKRGA